MPELFLFLSQTLLLTFGAAAATAIVLGTWPSPSGLLGVFLLYVVVVVFAEFLRAIPPGSFIFGQMAYDSIFTLAFVLLVLWAQSEFLRPTGHPRMTFNQAAYVFVIVGIAWSAFDYVARHANIAPK
jgi:uncharacterized membrane protein AbrB (regulator of aidB expression)